MSSPTLEKLSAQLTALIGPEAFAKAEAARAAAKATAEAAAKVAAEAAAKAAAAKAAAAAAPAKAAAPADGATPASAASTANVSSGSGPRPDLPKTAAPAPLAPKPAVAAAAVPRVAVAPATPATPAVPTPPALPPLPLQATDATLKGYDLDAIVAPAQVIDAAHLLDAAGFGLDAITGVDWLAQNEMEVVYDYFHPLESLRVVVRTRVPRATPEVPTIVEVFPGANWHERETHDFFGITFAGHPNLAPFLLPEDADFHPLRKDYAP